MGDHDLAGAQRRPEACPAVLRHGFKTLGRSKFSLGFARDEPEDSCGGVIVSQRTRNLEGTLADADTTAERPAQTVAGHEQREQRRQHILRHREQFLQVTVRKLESPRTHPATLWHDEALASQLGRRRGPRSQTRERAITTRACRASPLPLSLIHI